MEDVSYLSNSSHFLKKKVTICSSPSPPVVLSALQEVERDTAASMFVCDELSQLTDLVKVRQGVGGV